MSAQKGKIRAGVTLLPEWAKWLKKTYGGVAAGIKALIADAYREASK